MGLRFEITLEVDVDESANFLEVGEDTTLDVVKEKILDGLYDIDDMEVTEVDLVRKLD
jgi:hypothetical protein|tara:strand:+ start:1619 stop:1792 length:174 start_codon:yes stop_codon:yes gene_type:complete